MARTAKDRHERLWEYLEPFFCNRCHSSFDGASEFVYQRCPTCNEFCKALSAWPSRRPSTIPSAYFDTSLGMHIRGARHKSQVLKERNLVEIGSEPIPQPKSADAPVLTDSEWRTAWNEALSSNNSETGDA